MKRRKLVWFSGMLGWLFFSVAPTTQGFIAGTGKAANILVKKVHAPQWLLGYNFVFGCAAGFKENELKAAVTQSLQVWLQPLRERYPNKVFTDKFLFIRQPDMKACHDNKEATKQVDMRITFDCKVGVSSARVTTGAKAPSVYAGR